MLFIPACGKRGKSPDFDNSMKMIYCVINSQRREDCSGDVCVNPCVVFDDQQQCRFNGREHVDERTEAHEELVVLP
jgi:hypothetical protein